MLHRPLRDLNLIHRTGFTIAGVNRAGVDLPPSGSLRLAFADRVEVVGPRSGMKAIESELGNSPDTLNQPRLIPIFLGIVLGVLVGSIPLIVPGIHAKIRLGLAGGPLIIAVLLSQLGSVGSIVWYMPSAASRLFRDFGLAVFLVCVGLQPSKASCNALPHRQAGSCSFAQGYARRGVKAEVFPRVLGERRHRFKNNNVILNSK